MKVASFSVFPMALASLMLAGCITQQAHKGVVIDQQLVGALQPGVDNKASVEKLLGRPTYVGEFTPNDWYYVSRDTRQVAFRNPRVYKQTVLHVQFDQAGNVVSKTESGKQLVLGLDPSSRRTPTLGREKSLFEELFGNIGSVGAGGLGGSKQ